MANTYSKIQTVSVTDGSAPQTLSFTSIPQNYTDLIIFVSARGTADSYFRIRPNGATTGLTGVYLRGNGSVTVANTFEPWAYVTTTTDTAGVFSISQIYIANYASSSFYKPMSIENMTENNGAAAFQILQSGLWSSSTPITSLNLTMNTGGFSQYTKAILYGIRNS